MTQLLEALEQGLALPAGQVMAVFAPVQAGAAVGAARGRQTVRIDAERAHAMPALGGERDAFGTEPDPAPLAYLGR